MSRRVTAGDGGRFALSWSNCLIRLSLDIPRRKYAGPLRGVTTSRPHKTRKSHARSALNRVLFSLCVPIIWAQIGMHRSYDTYTYTMFLFYYIFLQDRSCQIWTSAGFYAAQITFPDSCTFHHRYFDTKIFTRSLGWYSMVWYILSQFLEVVQVGFTSV